MRPDWTPVPPLFRFISEVAQVGVEPTASLVLSESGLPVAYRAVLGNVQSGKGGSRTLKALRLAPVRAECHRPLACLSLSIRRRDAFMAP